MNTTFIDTHCHLNFKRFNKTRDHVINEAQQKEVGLFIVPGTDIPLSLKAVELATQNPAVYAAIGIHPHHTFDLKQANNMTSDIQELEKLITHPKVVAIGEVGLDRHVYEDTKYPEYQISEEFMDAQKKYFIAQLHLADTYKKALIIHNRETKKELLDILNRELNDSMRFHTVFHCCEPDDELLAYAIAHNIYIGIDGDVTYGGEKGVFAKNIPLDMLVLETDSPFLLPEPLKTQKLYPNTPANIPLITQCIASLKGIKVEEVAEATTRNAKRLFNLSLS
jgi:TatD DNase family protein